MKDPIIKASADCVREGRIRGGRQGSTRVDMRRADHDFAKRSELAHGYRESRADQVFLFMASHINIKWTVRRELSKALRAVVSADVAHDPDKGHNLSLERSFPSVKIGTAQSSGEQI